jgi:protein phosphatase
MKLNAFGISDIGIARSNNEDVWIALPEIGFFALADGMGGHNAGEIAAQMVIDSLEIAAKTIPNSDVMKTIENIRCSIENANRQVFNMGKQHRHYHGMGTTLCCIFWTKEAIIYAHVGDSRIYRLRNRKLHLLTQDHSLLAKWLSTGKVAQECSTPYPYKHVITRAVGCGLHANPEIAIATQEDGDLFFLCSDGLTDVLSLEEMESILNEDADVSVLGQKLIDLAKIKGSSDNMTIVMVQDAKNLSRQ